MTQDVRIRVGVRIKVDERSASEITEAAFLIDRHRDQLRQTPLLADAVRTVAVSYLNMLLPLIIASRSPRLTAAGALLDLFSVIEHKEAVRCLVDALQAVVDGLRPL